mmetsp:Transcript_32570/g.72461  ORF Transcript_32570/g.72461 Transcript_32570/m.72461 type:complete len:235 (+) Transcript_32570:856-1560(+)
MCSCSRTSTRTTRTSSCASRSPQSFRDRWSRANCLCGCSPTSSPNSDDTRPPPPCSKQKPTGQSTQGRRRQCRGRGLRRRSRRWGALTPATHCRSMSTRGRALVPAPTPCCLLGRGKVPWRDRRASLWGRNSRDRDRSRDRCRDRGRCRGRCRGRYRDRCRGRGGSRRGRGQPAGPHVSLLRLTRRPRDSKAVETASTAQPGSRIGPPSGRVRGPPERHPTHTGGPCPHPRGAG